MTMAIDCLAGYIFEEERAGNVIPEPSDIGDINIDAEYDGYSQAFVSMVVVDVEGYAKKYFT